MAQDNWKLIEGHVPTSNSYRSCHCAGLSLCQDVSCFVKPASGVCYSVCRTKLTVYVSDPASILKRLYSDISIGTPKKSRNARYIPTTPDRILDMPDILEYPCAY